MKTKISNDGQRCVSLDHKMLTPQDYPPPLGKNILVLTKQGKIVIGKWAEDCIQWFPIPDRA